MVAVQLHTNQKTKMTHKKYKRKGTGKKTEPTFTLYKGDWFEATFINLCGNRTVTSLDYLAIFLEVTKHKHYKKQHKPFILRS